MARPANRVLDEFDQWIATYGSEHDPREIRKHQPRVDDCRVALFFARGRSAAVIFDATMVMRSSAEIRFGPDWERGLRARDGDERTS